MPDLAVVNTGPLTNNVVPQIQQSSLSYLEHPSHRILDDKVINLTARVRTGMYQG